jgi:phage-related protein
MDKSVELAIKVTADARDAGNALEGVGDSAKQMANDVEQASRTADTAASRLDGVADSADNLDSKAGRATGALGALSSGFELMGPGGAAAAAGLQSAALATDFLSGAGQALTLVLELESVATAKAKVATIAHGVAAKATAAGQWVLNAAMAANPVLIIVAGIVALVAVLVLAYKKSETFRRIVDAAFGAVKDAAAAAFGWIKENWPLLLAILTGPIGLAVLVVVKNWDAIKAGAGKVLDAVEAIATKVKDGLVGAFNFLKDKAIGIFDAITQPIRDLIDLVQGLIDKIASIHIPHVDLNPFNNRAVAGTVQLAPAGTSTGTRGGDTFNINVTGAIDPEATARQILQILNRHNRRLGVTT